MNNVLSKIQELMQIREQKSRLLDKEMELSKTKINDYSIIPKVKDMFEDSHDTSVPYNRKKLLFVILLIFAPSVLAGYRMPKGLRVELVKIFPNVRPCSISNDIANLFFYYQHYKNFQTDVETLYWRIIGELTE